MDTSPLLSSKFVATKYAWESTLPRKSPFTAERFRTKSNGYRPKNPRRRTMGLFLDRKPDQTIIIKFEGAEVLIRMVEVRGHPNRGLQRCRLEFLAPKNVVINRGEILEEQQKAAAEVQRIAAQIIARGGALR
jgi:sRNA-binding carbon storage regulator CsrA